jgi:hypothetical protein
LKPDFLRFHEYFMRVPGRGDYPYLRPFNSAKNRTAAGEGGLWYQSNVAGSYSPSSVRRQGPLARVVDVSEDGLYSLREEHAVLALEQLAFGDRVPAVPLSIYLYREFAFMEPDLASLTSVFRYEFGYETAAGVMNGSDYQTLFVDDSTAGVSSDLFEEFDA